MEDSTITLETTAMANGGLALARHEGRAVFVPYTLPGEIVEARLVEEHRGFARAAFEALRQASPQRVAPRCGHFHPGGCGGCQWQHIDYAAQLSYKEAVVRDQMQRIGKIEQPPLHPIIPSPEPWAYRRSATFTTGADGELCFWDDSDSALIPIQECHIIHPALLALHSRFSLKAPNVARIRLQCGTDPADLMAVLYLADESVPQVAVDSPVSINVVLPDGEPANLIGSAHVTYQVLGHSFRVTAGGFFQVNPGITEALVQEVLTQLDLKGHETLLELYAGVGLFTAFTAPQCDLVLSVESYPPAVTDAEENLAAFENVELVEGDVEEVLDHLVGPFDAVLVDPPRAGLAPEVIDGLVRLAPLRLVYVSCDVATLARDAARLIRGGWRLAYLRPLDMFPQTYHLECVALFLR